MRSHRLTNAWLVSLNRVKSWLVVSKSALQISSNHSRRGPPQSRAGKHNKHKKWLWPSTSYAFCSFTHHFTLSTLPPFPNLSVLHSTPPQLWTFFFFEIPPFSLGLKVFWSLRSCSLSVGTHQRSQEIDISLVSRRGTSSFCFRLLRALGLYVWLYKLDHSIQPVNTILFVLTHDFFFPGKKEAGAGVASVCRGERGIKKMNMKFQNWPSSSWKTTSKFLLQSEMEKFRVAFRDWKAVKERKL